MTTRVRTNRYSTPISNRTPVHVSRRSTIDRMDQLTELSMSSYLDCRATLKKTQKVKGQLASAEALTFIPGEGEGDCHRLVVSDNRAGRIVVFANKAKVGRELIGGVEPQGVASLDSKMVVFVDDNTGKHGTLKIISLGDDTNAWGSVVAQWGRRDSDAWRPRGVAVTRNGQIVVTNVHPEASERFWMYSVDRDEAMSFGRSHGPADLVFQTPNYVTVDDFGRILATDTDGDCVKIFDSRWRYVGEFGRVARDPGEKDSKLSRPTGLTCDNRGNIIVCDGGNRRLAMFSHDGRFIQNLRHPQKTGFSPVDVALNPSADRLALSVHNRVGACRKMVFYNYTCT